MRAATTGVGTRTAAVTSHCCAPAVQPHMLTTKAHARTFEDGPPEGPVGRHGPRLGLRGGQQALCGNPRLLLLAEEGVPRLGAPHLEECVHGNACKTQDKGVDNLGSTIE